jgi:hypothetical protein
MKLHKLTESYSVRSESYLSELKKFPSTELRVKLEMNLSVSNLVLENLFSFYATLSENFDNLHDKGQKIGQRLRLVISKNPPNEIKRKVEEINLSNKAEKEEELKKVLLPVKLVERLGEHNDSINQMLDTLVKYQEESEKLVYKVFSFNKKAELKNGLKLLFRFIANLNPFVSGADSICQLVREKQIKYSTTDKCIRELNEYWNNCFSIAVTAKYLEKVLLSFVRSQSSVSVDAKECVDETYQKLTSMQAEFYEEVIKKIKEMKI